MEREDRHGVLMRGAGRFIVYSRLRAWLGMNLEIPRLLRGVDFPRGALCLDIAAGLGWASAGLLRRDPSARIVALDYDETILPRMRAFLDSHGAAAAIQCRGDGKRLPFRDGAFDLIVCLYGLHHLRGYQDALREIARALKGSGVFALIDPVRTSGQAHRHDGTEVPTRAELERMLAAAGFETVHARLSHGTMKAVARKGGGPAFSFAVA